MSDIYLTFIEENQAEELLEWGSEYNQATLANDYANAAWDKLQNNITELKINKKTLKIIQELLRWNNEPICLTTDDQDKNFLIKLIYKAAFTHINSSTTIRNILTVIKKILYYVNIEKVADSVLINLSIYCIQNLREEPSITNKFASILSFLLKKCPFLLDTKAWDNCLKFIREDKRVEAINLLSMALHNNSLKKQLITEVIISYMLGRGNADRVDIGEIPFGVRSATIQKKNEIVKYVTCSFYSNLTSEISVRNHMKIALNKSKLLNHTPYIYINNTFQSETVTLYFSYPVNHFQDFDLTSHNMKMSDYPKDKFAMKLNDEAILMAKRALLKRDDFYSLPSEFLFAHFDNSSIFYDKNSMVKDYLGLVDVEIKHRIDLINHDNKKIHSMLNDLKFNDDSNVNAILEDLHDYILTLITCWRTNKPYNFLINKFKVAIKKLLLNIFLNKNVLFLLGERRDNFELIDNIIDMLESLCDALADRIGTISFNIPAVFYQVMLKKVCLEYQAINNRDQSLDELNDLFAGIQNKNKQPSDCFRKLISILDAYTQAKLAEKNQDSEPTLERDDFRDISITEIFISIKEVQFSELFLDDFKKIINICKVPFAAELGLESISDEIRKKAEIFKLLNTFYTQENWPIFYQYLSNHSEIFFPLADLHNQLSVTIQIMAMLFKKEKKFDGVIIINNASGVAKIENYFNNFLKPLIEKINDTREELLPNPRENGFFKIMVNKVLSDTLDLIHHIILQVELTDSEEGIIENLSCASEFISVLLNPYKYINTFISEEIKSALQMKLVIINKLSQKAVIVSQEKNSERQQFVAPKQFNERKSNFLSANSQKSEKTGVIGKITDFFASLKTTATVEKAIDFHSIDYPEKKQFEM